MELTQAQTDYIGGLTDEWNKLIADKSPKDFITDELGMAIVTSTAASVAAMMQQWLKDPESAKIWGMMILGAFLYSEGLLKIGSGDTLQ